MNVAPQTPSMHHQVPIEQPTHFVRSRSFDELQGNVSITNFGTRSQSRDVDERQRRLQQALNEAAEQIRQLKAPPPPTFTQRVAELYGHVQPYMGMIRDALMLGLNPKFLILAGVAGVGIIAAQLRDYLWPAALTQENNHGPNHQHTS